MSELTERVEGIAAALQGSYEADIDLMTRRDKAQTEQIAELIAANAELQETLEFAASYKGIEGRPCPLCTYDDGVFIKSCQMHTDMDKMQKRLAEAHPPLAIRTVEPFVIDLGDEDG